MSTINPNHHSPGRRLPYRPFNDRTSIVPDDVALDYMLSLCSVVAQRQFFFHDPEEHSRYLLITNINALKVENSTESTSFLKALRIKILAAYNNKMPDDISTIFSSQGVTF